MPPPEEVMVPLTLAFVIAARRAGRAQANGISALIKACAVQASGLVSLGVIAEVIDTPSMFDLMVPLTLFGYGQGFVMAQLFSTVLRSVAHSRAGSASGVLATTQQVANATGVAIVGAIYFGAQAAHSQRIALVAALITLIIALALCVAALEWLRRSQSPGEVRRLDPPLRTVQRAGSGARAAS